MTTHTLAAHDGQLVVAQRGARLLSATLPAVEGNLFFENEQGSGGDRLWIAPEVAYFWPSLEQARQDPIKWARTLPQMDPGDYVWDAVSSTRLCLKTTMSLADARDGKRIDLDVTRSMAVVNPPADLPQDVASMSFSTTHTLIAVGGDAGAVAGAWSLLQVPPAGTLICPTTMRVAPRSYYDSFGDQHVSCDAQAVRFLIDANRRIKMGLRPKHTTGRMGYYRQVQPGFATLIVRVFSVYPDEPYIDIPRDYPIDQRHSGDALQAYNDDLTFGLFGEMEHHDPAVVVGGCQQRTGHSVTHLLAGPDPAIRAAGQALLGVPIDPIA